MATALGIEHLIHGRFTGETVGTPCFREGKVERLDQWLAQLGQPLRDFAETVLFRLDQRHRAVAPLEPSGGRSIPIPSSSASRASIAGRCCA